MAKRVDVTQKGEPQKSPAKDDQAKALGSNEAPAQTYHDHMKSWPEKKDQAHKPAPKKVQAKSKLKKFDKFKKSKGDQDAN